MEESTESCVDRGHEPDKETVELLRLIEKYPVVILTLLVSPHIQDCTYIDNKIPYSKFHIYKQNLMVYININMS